MAVNYHLGGFPPDTLDWPRLLPLIGPANAVCGSSVNGKLLLWLTKSVFVSHNIFNV